jgi:hypothetical protein
MIKSFKHKGLKEFFYTGSKKGIRPEHADRLERILDRLNAANESKTWIILVQPSISSAEIKKGYMLLKLQEIGGYFLNSLKGMHTSLITMITIKKVII